MGEPFNPADRGDGRQFPLSFDGKKWTYHTPWIADRLRFMCRSGGYVMVRKPRATPFVMAEKDWAKMPIWTIPPPASDGEG